VEANQSLSSSRTTISIFDVTGRSNQRYNLPWPLTARDGRRTGIYYHCCCTAAVATLLTSAYPYAASDWHIENNVVE